MPRSIARFSASSALSSSWYMRKRLPHPNARIETLAPVRPRVRDGSGSTILGVAAAASFRSDKLAPAAVPKPIRSRKFLRESSLLMDLSSTNPNRIGTWLPKNLAQTGGLFDRPRTTSTLAKSLLPRNSFIVNDGNGENQERASTGLSLEEDSNAVLFPRPQPLLGDAKTLK